MKAIVDYLDILGPKNIFYHIFIEIKVSPTILKL